MTAKTLPLLRAVACPPLPLLACLAAALCLTACSHHLAPLGHYQNTPVVADGVADDWTLPLRFTNANYTLQYNITNDNKNIYVCALSRDEGTIIRMLRAGITVYFDPKGLNGRDISLHYPLRKQPDPRISGSNGDDRNGEPRVSLNDSGWKEELLRQSDSYGTAGFSGIDNGQFAVTGTKSPIRVAIKLDGKLLVYEAVVPIASVLGADLGSRNPEKALSVGVVLNTPSGQTATIKQHHPGNGHTRNYNTNSNDNLPIKEDVNWYRFRLAITP